MCRSTATGAVFDALMAAGEPHGIATAGYRAIESLRLEKGYRAWGADITPDDTPLEAGLGWAVKLKQNTPFLGREALAAQAGKPLAKRLACFTVDDPDVVLLGRETIFRDGAAGRLADRRRLGLHGRQEHRLRLCAQRAEGVATDWLTRGRYELEVATERVPAEIHLAPLYDPAMARIKS